MDTSDHLYVSFVRDSGPSVGHGLYYATNLPGSWSVTKIAPMPVAAAGTDIAIDSHGKVHIVYSKESSGIYYATNRTGQWVKTKLASPSALDMCTPRIAVDQNAKAHIAYCGSGAHSGIVYTTNASGSWVNHKIDTSSQDDSPDIAVDAHGHASVIVTHVGTGYVYFTDKTGHWTSKTLLAGSIADEPAAIKLDSAGHASVAMTKFSAPSIGVRYAHLTSSGWVTATIGSSPAFVPQGIVRTPDGFAHILRAETGLNVLDNESGSWQFEVIVSSSDHPGADAAIASSTDGSMAVVYSVGLEAGCCGPLGVATRAAP